MIREDGTFCMLPRSGFLAESPTAPRGRNLGDHSSAAEAEVRVQDAIQAKKDVSCV